MDKIYKFLEDINIFDDLYNVPASLRDIVKNKKLPEHEQNHLEIECAIFGIIDNIITGREEWMSKAYSIIDTELDYIADRINITNNILLKAIYSEILFYSENSKYKKYVNTAAESYLSVVKIFHEKIKEHPDNIYDFCNFIKKAVHLTKSANKKTDNIKNEIKSILNTNSFLNTKFVPLTQDIIKVMLYNNKIFNKNDFEGIDDIFWQSIKKKIKEKDYRYVINTIDLGIKIDKKRNKLSYPWLNEKCKCYELLIKQEKNPMIASALCIEEIETLKAMDCIRSNIHNVEKQYTKIKNKIVIPYNVMKVDVTHSIKLADIILTFESSKILEYLSFENILLPQQQILEKQPGFLAGFFAATYLDHNSHPSKITRNEVINDLYLSNYRNVWILCNTTIQRVIIESIKNKKITFKTLLNYLIDETCLFDLQKKLLSGKKVKFNWGSNIIKIFEVYFKELEKYFNSPKKYYPHLIEITDSLVLRFETLLRLILETYNKPSITTRTKEKGVIREQDINLLLYNESLMDILFFEDILYFRYLFTAHQGYNLRNDIAHGLLLPEQYTIELFNLVFFAFLRLSKYILPNKKSDKLKFILKIMQKNNQILIPQNLAKTFIISPNLYIP